MPVQKINIGAAPNDKTGDSLREAFALTNAAIDQVNANTEAIAGKVDKAAGMGLSQNSFTNEQRDKLNGLEGSHWRGTFLSVSALQAALPTANAGDYADVDTGVGSDVQRYIWDVSDAKWVLGGGATSLTAAQVKALYEANPDTNVFTDAEQTKLESIAPGATVNQTDAYLRNRANHTGTQSMETVDGLSDALEALEVVVAKAVQQTSATGMAVLPEGPPIDSPDPLPAEGLLVRGNSTTGKPEWFNRVKAAWQPFGTDGGELFSYAWHNGPRASIATLTPGRIPADGQQITLLQYPDAVAAILAGKQNVVTEAVWQADPTKRNCWSLGDGASWVRVPDLNAVQAGTGKPFYLRGGPDALNGTSIGDAIRNITGSMPGYEILGTVGSGTGAMRVRRSNSTNNYSTNIAPAEWGSMLTLDSSLVVPTADENRVKTAYGVMTVRIFTEAANAGSVDAATLATQLAVVDAKVQALDAATGFTILYPNGGSAAAPANVAVNSRYVMPSPFPGSHVLCLAEVMHDGKWGRTGWYSDPTYVLGVSASQYGESDIVVQTGRTGLLPSNASDSGSPFPVGPKPAALPCRVKVWKLKGAM